jgi:hypothetical protein
VDGIFFENESTNPMKSLIIAFVFFGVLVYGCYDVKPFQAIRRVLKRTPGKTGPLRRTGPLPQEPVYPQEYPEYPVRRRYQ